MNTIAARRFALLALLSRNPRLTIAELVDATGTSRMAVRYDLGWLMRAGYIARRRCATGIDVLVKAAYLPPPSTRP